MAERAPTRVRSGARRGRGHPHALRHAQGAAPAVRAADAAARPRRARRAAARPRSWWSSATVPRTSPRRVQAQLVGDVPVEFVEQTVQRGTGDAASVALTAFADDLDADDDLLVLLGDAPLLRPETLAMLATEHRRADAAATLLTARLDDPTGYGRVVRDARGDVDRIVEQRDADARRARDRRGQPVDLLLPPRPPRARAAAPQPRERPGRVLPHRRRRRAAPGRAPRRGHRGRRRHRGARRSTTAPSSPTAEAAAAPPHQRRSGCARASPWSTPPAPTSTPPSSSSPTCGSCPGTMLSGHHGRAHGLGGRPRQPARRHASSGSGAVGAPDRRPRGGDRRRRHRRPVRVAAARHPPGGGRARRHVRRDQEQRDRRGRQGARTSPTSATPTSATAPTSARATSPPTTTAGTSTAPRSGATCAPGRTRCSSRRSRWATAPTPAPARS